MGKRVALLVSACVLPLVTAVAGIAGASDLPAPVPAIPAASWTGLYLGAHAGSGLFSTQWGNGTGELATSAAQRLPVDGDAGGVLVGGQIGYNQQIGDIVLGAEADVSTGQLNSTVRCLNDWRSTCSTDTDVMGTLTARAGYAFDNILLYGKAGMALANSNFAVPGGGYVGRYTGSDTLVGWTVGAGVEIALTQEFSARAEYNYIDFGSASAELENGGLSSSVDLSQSAQIVKLGLNWRPGAAPLPGTAPVASAATRDWSGLYVGGHAGGAWARNEWISSGGVLASVSELGSFPGAADGQGLFGGGQIGVNYQFGSWVAGLDASLSATDLDSHAKCATNNVGSVGYVCRDGLSSFGTLAGRLGRGWGDFLIYAKAGAAWADAGSEVQESASTDHSNSSGTRWGWMAGAGVEYAIDARLSAFIEYNHMDFGTQDLAFAGTGGASTASLNQTLDAVRLGLNYRFAGDDTGSRAVATPAASTPSGWSAEIGARYFLSSGRMQKDLFDPHETLRLNSRLIYEDTTGQAGETFFRFDNDNGLFLKGFAGLGQLNGGSLYDEDFPAGPAYSNTLSSLHAGRLSYGALDVGYDAVSVQGGSLGAFIGYRALYQGVDGYGCMQVGLSDLCGAADRAAYPALASNLGLSETELWQGVALGLNARLRLSDRVTLDVDAAYLPYVTRSSYDNHWFRPDINPQSETGDGWGTQIEAALTYAVNDRLDIGIGGRYWFFATDNAQTQFPSTLLPSPQTFYTERYGAFLQASYRFGDRRPAREAGDLPVKAAEPAMNWTGLYAGGTLGAGKAGSSYQSPFVPPVTGDAVDLGGAIAGGQIGVDYQMGDIVIGAEASGAWANIVGTNTCFSTAPAGDLSGFNCGSRVDALMTATARLGYAFDRALIYMRGGFAWDRQKDSFNNFNFVGQVLDNRSSNGGWTLGAGIDYALLPNMSVGLEYRHVELDASSAFYTTAPASLTGVNLAPDSTKLDIIAMTVNWRFGATP